MLWDRFLIFLKIVISFTIHSSSIRYVFTGVWVKTTYEIRHQVSDIILHCNHSWFSKLMTSWLKKKQTVCQGSKDNLDESHSRLPSHSILDWTHAHLWRSLGLIARLTVDCRVRHRTCSEWRSPRSLLEGSQRKERNETPPPLWICPTPLGFGPCEEVWRLDRGI